MLKTSWSTFDMPNVLYHMTFPMYTYCSPFSTNNERTTFYLWLAAHVSVNLVNPEFQHAPDQT